MSALALLKPRELSDLSPQIGPKRALIRLPVTNCDFMSTRPTSPVSRGGALCSSGPRASWGNCPTPRQRVQGVPLAQ